MYPVLFPVYTACPFGTQANIAYDYVMMCGGIHGELSA